MGNPNIAPVLAERFNVAFTIDAQLRERDTLEANPALRPLFWTIEATNSISDPTSDTHRYIWPEFDSLFREFEGTPFYRTMRTRFADVVMKAFSSSFSVTTEERRRLLTQRLLPGIIADIGKGAGQRELMELLTVMNTADVLEAYDGSNLADTNHEGALFNLATGELDPITQINFSTAFPLSAANLEIVRSRMMAYRNSQGNHFGNMWTPRTNQPAATGDRQTIAIIEPQFHIYVAKDLEATAENLLRIIEAGTNVFAERFTYSIHDELPAGTWVVWWLNNRNQQPSQSAAFLHKRTGVSVFQSMGFENLENMRHRRHEINAHSDFGFDPLHWHRFYLARSS